MTTLTRGGRRLRTALAAMLATVGLLALAGCMKIDMDMTLSEDDTVSGSMVMAYSNQLAETMGMEPQELWDQAGGDLESTLPEGATQQPYADDEYTGTEVTFLDMPLEDFSTGATGDRLSITRDGDDFVVDGVMDLSRTEELGAMPEGMEDALDVRIAVTFPGPVTESNGTVDGTTVTWAPAMGETTELHAVGAAKGGFPWWLVGLVIGVLVLAVVVVLVVRANRHRTTSTATAAGTPAGPTPEQQVFGAPDDHNPSAPVPTTGPVPEPLEPGAPTTPADRPETGAGPVTEPFEPAPTEPAPTRPETDEATTGETESAAGAASPDDSTSKDDPSEDTGETAPDQEDDADGTGRRRPTDPPQGA